MSFPLVNAEPYDLERTAWIIDQLDRDGFVHLPSVLSPAEVDAFKERIDRAFEDERTIETHNRMGDFVMGRLFELDPMFQALITREPIISLVEAILGPDCHMISQNCIRNKRGQAIDSFHVDDKLHFPVTNGMERHDPRLKMPILILSVQMALTDTPADEYGPTQFVPASHYSGQVPNDLKNPTFEGRGPVSVHAKAGDIYLQNGQCWHRGHPNESDRTRYLMGPSFGRRWISQRLYPFVNYQLPREVIDRADERCLRLLGQHPKGPYG